MDKDYSEETSFDIHLHSTITYDGLYHRDVSKENQVIKVPEIETEIVVADGYTAFYIRFNKNTIRLMVDHAIEDVGAFVEHWQMAVMNPTRTDRRDQ